MKSLILALAAACIGPTAIAHNGAINGEGCHDDALAGSFHCHTTGHTPQAYIGAVIQSEPNLQGSAYALSPDAAQSNFTAKTIEDDQVFAAQVVLKKNGCYDGRLDGVMADGTIYALKLFEANAGLPVTGALSSDTQNALRHSSNRFDICR